ncbi:glycosyltransferase family 87 protein [Rubrobacter indicoceani]|uniref:glycosyltransferase family 87 protein n=1 Tax=Rubrobacter indicoceani TaxID=2051957 RepID=UPI000E5B18B6|nr:glycosyltransferase family 87 protein [Rubrobacter indicoceani]
MFKDGRRKAGGERWYTGRLRGILLYALGAGAILLSIGVYGEFLSGMLGRISTEDMDIHADFNTFWRSADAYRYGRDLYSTGARLVNLNPPLWTILISPLAFLDPIVAYRIFTQLTLVTVVGYVVWLTRRLNITGGWAATATAMVLVSSPVLGTLALGQIYAFLTLGLVAAWLLERRGLTVASGLVLGVTIALKPSLLPLVLWPLLRGRWKHLLSTLGGGAGATLFAALVAGFGATFEWLRLLSDSPLNTYWDNASLPSAAARLFTENQFATNLTELPFLVKVAYGLGVVAVVLSAWLSRRDPELGFWAIVAASLIVAPIAWHNYLMLLVPGVFLLLHRKRYAAAFFLLALQIIPPQWPLIWQEDTKLAAVMLSLYAAILVIHWAFLLPLKKRGSGEENPASGAPASQEHLRRPA